ncbi:ABC transporter permease [Paenibacillus sp.]|jgi:putative ABC transport system permease protein|uniref:ABC transporter permease n=1 Tax=Paenibacillus sp. TaxID=58172 RepID=UPI00281DD713|nr:ABC transporter permease [Paenibacillus sp.]MDR0266543.1 ABC transporter permease [Paenibacillus sp.]
MFTMRSIAMKLFRAAWAHVSTSISIIAISICLVMTMSLYIWNANAQMKEEIHAQFGYVDVTVGYNTEQEKTLSTSLLRQIRSLKGIDTVSPISLKHTTVDHMTGVYTLGVENDDLVKSRYHFSTDLKLNEMIISEGLAKALKKEIGDRVLVQNEAFVIKEIVPTMKAAESTSFVLLPNSIVKQWMPLANNETQGLFALIAADNPSTMGMKLKQLDNSLRVELTNDNDFVKRNLQSLMIFIIVLSVFILIITGMLLLSTFQLLFYKLKEQLMVLRSLGASARQIGRMINTQLSAIILLGVIFGTTGGVLIIKIWLPQLVSLLSLPVAKNDFPAVFVFAIAIASFCFLQLFTKRQVKKAMQLLPLQIASDNEDVLLKWTVWKKIFVSMMTLISILCLLAGQSAENANGKGALLIIVGSLLLCGVVLLIIPFIFKALLNITLQPVRSLFGKEVYMAFKQLLPQIKRNSTVVLSLIGLMVILIFGSSLLKTIQSNEQTYINERYKTSIILTNQMIDSSITPSIVEKIENLPSITYAYAKSYLNGMQFKHEGNLIYGDYASIDVAEFTKIGLIEPVDGDLTNGVIITKEFAKKNHLSLGDSLLGIHDTSSLEPSSVGTYQVLAIIPEPLNLADVYIDWSSTIARQAPPMIGEIMVETTDTPQAIGQLQDFLQQYSTFRLSDKETIMNQANEVFYQRWSLFVVVFIVLIAATSLGVIQTLLHTIYVKRNDYAIQRLIGLSPNSLMKLILTQVFSFVLYGLTTGTILGLLLTRMLVFIDSEAEFVFDFSTLLTVSLFLLISTLCVFTAQGYWISRSKMSVEMKNI